MNRRAAIALIVSLGSVAALVVAFTGGPKGAATAFPTTGSVPGTPLPAQCLSLPDGMRGHDAPLLFVPLPEGSYVADVADESGVARYTTVVAASLDDFVAFLLEEWPAQGWELGRGEREPGEAETVFFNDELIGQVVARSVFCDRDRTHVTLLIAERSAQG